MSTSYYLTPNQQDSSGIYQGLTYVFDTSGGFAIDQAFPQINLNTYSPIAQYDVTDALQIRFSVRTMNNKIGIIKDQSNIEVLQVLYYNNIMDVLEDVHGTTTESVTVTSDDFLSGISTANIVSMGKMSRLYSDFNYTVMEYFGAPYGFSTVFSGASEYNINNGVFDKTAFINLINGITFDGITGSVISDLSGYFTVNDLNKHLRFICGTNVFGNRQPTGNFGLTDGFIPGDLIYIPNGISITLTVAVEPEPYTPINNVGPTNLHDVDDLVNWSDPQTNVHKVTTSTITDITQKYSVPILIIVDNLDTFNFGNYGAIWSDIGTSIGNQPFISVCISSLGTYQSVITDQGDVFISDDYGVNWYLVNNFGISPVASIGVSQTGEFQTISNGVSIYISQDYGWSWNEVFSLGSSNVFVSVSLSGKYQAVLSCGDSLYSSIDFGQTWTRFEEERNPPFYASMQGFPTGGLSLSFTGQYQSIACETIWLSSDYGETWTDAFVENQFNDHNWDGISISSNGRIQSATDSGGYIYNSQDYGITWNIANANNKTWFNISISANANYQTAIDIDGYIYLSLDYGLSWSLCPDENSYGRKWQGISVSANGQYQTAIEYNGSIWSSNML